MLGTLALLSVTHAVALGQPKPHGFLPLSGLTHRVADPNRVMRQHEAIVGFFRRQL